ncbi:MAG: ParB N-terminal domain-containing protein [Rhizobiaceae bacterium]|nr:ParB N-terminal domain-containing protein [Rhizobiaceae bacterium]
MNHPASQPYQLLPELLEDEFQALVESIAEHGVLVPVEYDEDGNILDGHHRVAACEKLGLVDWPKIIRSNMSENEKRMHVRVLNVARRQLSTQEKRALISAQILDTPEISSRRIGGILGVCHKTVGRVRDNLVRRGTVPHVPELEDSRGRMQPAKRPAQYVPVPADNKLHLDQAKTIRDNRMRNKREIRFERDRLICEAGKHVTGKMPRKAFSVIYADPPWEDDQVYDKETGSDKAPPYPTMPLNEIIFLCAGTKSPAIDNAVLFLWTRAKPYPRRSLQTVVPVPAALPLFGAGIVFLGLLSGRRKRRAS